MRASSSSRSFASERLHRALRHAVAGGLADAVVRVALRGDLRQVGHAQHLALRAERAQFLADDLGDGAADAGIDFVEHHRRHGIQAERGDFDRQRDARQFAARGDLAQRRAAAGRGWRRPGIRRARRPAGRARSPSIGFDRDLETCRRPCRVRRSARWSTRDSDFAACVRAFAERVGGASRQAARAASISPSSARTRSPAPRSASSSAASASRCAASASGVTRCLRARSCRRARRRSSSSKAAGSRSRSARTRSSSRGGFVELDRGGVEHARRRRPAAVRARPGARVRCAPAAAGAPSDGPSSPPRRASAASQAAIRPAACAWRRCAGDELGDRRRLERFALQFLAAGVRARRCARRRRRCCDSASRSRSSAVQRARGAAHRPPASRRGGRRHRAARAGCRATAAPGVRAGRGFRPGARRVRPSCARVAGRPLIQALRAAVGAQRAAQLAGRRPSSSSSCSRSHASGVGRVAEVEHGDQFRAFGAVAHHAAVGAHAGQEAQRIDQQRLAGAGFAGDHGQAGAEIQFGGADDGEILDGEMGQHGRDCAVEGSPAREPHGRTAH